MKRLLPVLSVLPLLLLGGCQTTNYAVKNPLKYSIDSHELHCNLANEYSGAYTALPYSHQGIVSKSEIIDADLYKVSLWGIPHNRGIEYEHGKSLGVCIHKNGRGYYYTAVPSIKAGRKRSWVNINYHIGGMWWGESQLGWTRLSRSQSGLNRSVPSNKDIPETIGNIRDGGTKRSVIDFDKINLTVVDTDYEPKKRVFCWRKDKLISNLKIYSADKCEPGDKNITPYQSYAISDFLKEGLSEDRLRKGVEFFLEHPQLQPE